jgi:hypothetical protein
LNKKRAKINQNLSLFLLMDEFGRGAKNLQFFIPLPKSAAPPARE